MIEHVTASLGGGDSDLEILLDLVLADVFVETPRT
jgi:hypothetical protein